MAGDLARKLAHELVRCRESSGHNRLSVEHFSRGEALERGEEFFVHNTSLLKYEKGGWPSPPKLLTMARAYGVPVSRFLKALGAGDEEICGHVVKPGEDRLFEALRDPVASELYGKLQALLDSPCEESRAALAVLEMAAARLPKQGTSKGKRSARGKGRFLPSAERGVRDLPFFADGFPKSAPLRWKPAGFRTTPLEGVQVVSGYLTRVADDSMSPELREGDWVLVDWAREPKSGSIVCVTLNGQPLIRQWRRRGPQRLLHPFNPSYEDVLVKKTDQFESQGVVLRVVERDLTGL